MSLATTPSHYSLYHVFDVAEMSESSGEQNKADKKREYNRNAQRVFRQRRKEHLNKLEQAQREQSSLQSEEVERLRRANVALTRENEDLKAAVSSATSSPGASISPTDVRPSPSTYLYSQPTAYLESQPESAPISNDQGNLVVVVTNNVREIRQYLHQLFAPVLTVMADPAVHLATLEAIQPTLPMALRPTPLQLTTPHHVYIDMLPSPSLRDRLISIGPAHSHTFLMTVCTITCDIEDTGQLIVWGEDWLNEFSWEFSAAVLERWGGWLLTPEWGRRANFWRRQRGVAVLSGYE